jgi:hypothetical protein
MDQEPAAGKMPSFELLRMMLGYSTAQAIFVATRLGIADQMLDGPRSCADLATATGMPATSLLRLLRALSTVGVFEQVDDDVFELTPLAAALRRDVPGSMRATGVAMGEILYRAWSELLYSLETGNPGFDRAFGTDFFSYLAAHPELGESFQEMMSDLNAVTDAAIPASCDFNGVHRVIDVGGGDGSLLAAILKAHPTLHGVLFDQPHVLNMAHRHLSDAGVAERCELVGGDFFDAVPAGGDVYVLRWILHDFDDARAERILHVVRTAIPESGQLLVVEQVLPTGTEPGSWLTAFQDLNMLVMVGGQERTASHFGDLFASGGFQLRRIIQTPSPSAILEAVPCASWSDAA